MHRFKNFVIKEFYHIFRDLRTLLILFGMPVAQIIIFGFVVSNDIKDIRIAIIDRSKDEVTKKLSEKLAASGFFIIDEITEDYNRVEDVFKEGHIKELILFEDNFSEKLQRDSKANVMILADASDANTANLIVNYTSAIIRDFNQELNSSDPSVFQVVPEVRMFYNEELKGAFMFVPGTMAMILLLISAMMTSISIAREKENGTMEALLVSPLRPFQIVVGKVTPYVILSFINAITIIGMGYFVFGVPITGSLVLLMAETILFIILALSIGILISTLTSKQQTAMFISMFTLMLPAILLSGFIFPLENMPRLLQWLSHIFPPRYFLVIIKNIMLKGSGFFMVWKETLILISMLLIFIGVSIYKFKIRLE